MEAEGLNRLIDRQKCGSRRAKPVMSVKSSTELMLYVVLTMPTLNKAYLFIYLLPVNGETKIWKPKG